MKQVVKAVHLVVLLAAALAMPGCGDAVSHSSDPTPATGDPSVAGRADAPNAATNNGASGVTGNRDDASKDAGTAKNDSSDGKDATVTDRVERSDEEWRKMLSPEQYYVLRQKGTERPWVNKYDQHFEPGSYACAGCGQVLFESDTKFNSGCGWPAFYAAKAGDRVKLHNDFSFGMIRTEVTCAKCGGHLGHVFEDAPQTPTGQRYCINSAAMKFIPKKSDAATDKDAKSKETGDE